MSEGTVTKPGVTPSQEAREAADRTDRRLIVGFVAIVIALYAVIGYSLYSVIDSLV